jgi:hypothetical protein
MFLLPLVGRVRDGGSAWRDIASQCPPITPPGISLALDATLPIEGRVERPMPHGHMECVRSDKSESIESGHAR